MWVREVEDGHLAYSPWDRCEAARCWCIPSFGFGEDGVSHITDQETNSKPSGADSSPDPSSA